MKNKVVLITGAGGFVGTHLLKALCSTNKVVALDTNENRLRALQDEYQCSVEVGAIEDNVFVNYVFAKYRPDVVIHCAARKHVLSGEQNPLETINVNISGTLNVFTAANEYKCEACILVSTDKADKPINVYGETKAVCERLAQSFAKMSSCKYLTIRFCNIYGSSGSVVEIFRDRIKNNKPLKITSSAKRYFITVDKVVECILKLYAQGTSGSIYMTNEYVELNIEDIAKEIALELDVDFNSLDITYTKCSEYEKLQEDYSTTSGIKILD